MKRAGLAAAVVAAGLIAFPAPAGAHPHHGDDRGHGRHVKHHAGHRQVYYHVPRRFAAAHRHAYRAHYHGRVYHAAHRHHHDLYRFPVRVGGHLVYRPYAYCGEVVHLEHPAPLPRLAFGLSFGEPGGFYFSGYYRD
jgi:hypothetical protein